MELGEYANDLKDLLVRTVGEAKGTSLGLIKSTADICIVLNCLLNPELRKMVGDQFHSAGKGMGSYISEAMRHGAVNT